MPYLVRFCALLFLVSAAGLVLAPSVVPSTAFACDGPGTPNNESVAAIGHGALNYFFDNTARLAPGAGPNDDLKLNLFFDIEMKELGMQDGQHWVYIENEGPNPLGYREKKTYRITTQQTRHVNGPNLNAHYADQPLKSGKTYCVRTWSRSSDNGCRSVKPSSWQCARVQ